MKELTVTCVFVRGHVPFTPEYVVRLRSMARRSLPPHRFVCLTDHFAWLPDDIETITVEPPPREFAWWTKVQLFNTALGFSGRMMYLDLDVLLVGDLSAVYAHPDSFVLAPDGAPAFRPRNRDLKVVKRFNSSVMAWDAGTHHELFADWTPAVAKRLWGDQDWIGERCPQATALPAEWFPRLSKCGAPPWPEHAKVVLCKKPKNHDAVVQWPWFDQEWR